MTARSAIVNDTGASFGSRAACSACSFNSFSSSLISSIGGQSLPNSTPAHAGYNWIMTQRTGYTDEHAVAGLDAPMPDIDTFPNQYPAYEIVIDIPEFTSVCPKTSLPDFGVLAIR